MKKLLTLLLITSCCLHTKAQDSLFTHVRTITGDIASFTVDNLDNIYILNSKNQLKKLDANGDSAAAFNDVRKFGKATLVDVSNPLKVLLYYKDFATIVVLDRFLNIRNTIDLRKQNIFQVRSIGQSYDNKIWLYDELESKLKKLDDDGKVIQETPDFRLLLGQTIAPVRIYDENKYVYLYDTAKGVYVFDYYGTLKNNILIQQWRNFKVTGKYIYGSKSDTLYRYEISRFLYDEWTVPPQLKGAKAFNFTSSRLYALKENTIEIYAVK